MCLIDAFVNEYSRLLSRPPVDKDDVKAVQTWFNNHAVPWELADEELVDECNFAFAIDSPEAAFIQKEDDLIPVSPKNRLWLSNVLERTALLRTRFFGRFLQRKPQDIETIGDGLTVWHNEKRVEKVSSTVIFIVGLAMLVGPLWILENLSDLPKKLGAITGFIVLFFVLVEVGTAARAYEALAVTAAYSAVLMVFLQFGSVR